MKQIRWWAAVGLAIGTAIYASLPANAEHFDITLRLRNSKEFVDAGWDSTPPEGGVQKRPVLTAAAGEDLVLEWTLRSEYPHGVMKRVHIHLFAAKEGEIGQRELPPRNTPHVFDNSFVADFLPKHISRGHTTFRVMEPGAYLIRLQSEETQKEHDHEHFSAIDLKVE